MKFKIGTIKIDFQYEDTYFNKVAQNYKFDGNETDVDIEVEFVDKVVVPNNEKIGENHISTWFKGNDGGYIVCGMRDEYNDYVYRADYSPDYRKIRIYIFNFEKICKMDGPVLVKNVLEIVLRPVVIYFDSINIHSSAISYNNNGIIFSASSGTGKSTHTSLWQKNYPSTIIVNDDMPLICEINKKFMLCGTPWAGTSGINKNIDVPLKAIVFLQRDTKNTITRISTFETLKLLMPQINIYPEISISSIQYDLLDRLITNVPTYVLGCTISDEAVETVKNELNL